MVSLVYSMAEILSKEVFDTSFIFSEARKTEAISMYSFDSTDREKYFLSETGLQSPSYKSYKIYFEHVLFTSARGVRSTATRSMRVRVLR